MRYPPNTHAEITEHDLTPEEMTWESEGGAILPPVYAKAQGFRGVPPQIDRRHPPMDDASSQDHPPAAA